MARTWVLCAATSAQHKYAPSMALRYQLRNSTHCDAAGVVVAVIVVVCSCWLSHGCALQFLLQVPRALVRCRPSRGGGKVHADGQLQRQADVHLPVRFAKGVLRVGACVSACRWTDA